ARPRPPVAAAAGAAGPRWAALDARQREAAGRGRAGSAAPAPVVAGVAPAAGSKPAASATRTEGRATAQLQTPPPSPWARKAGAARASLRALRRPCRAPLMTSPPRSPP